MSRLVGGVMQICWPSGIQLVVNSSGLTVNAAAAIAATTSATVTETATATADSFRP